MSDTDLAGTDPADHDPAHPVDSDTVQSPPQRAGAGRRRTAFLHRPGQFSTALAVGVVMLLVSGTGILGFRLGSRSPLSDLPPEFANVGLVLGRISSDAVEQAEADALVDGAIDGMLATLDDPYAVYYDPDRYDALTADLEGEFVGVGITIEERTDGVFVTGVIPTGPAEEAGVMAGERIVSIDGTPVPEDATSSEVVAQIAGEEGDTRVIGLDMGDDGPREVTLTLRAIELPQVAARTLESGYGHVVLSQFSRGVSEQLAEEITALEAAGVPGIVLDLRGNPGGLLNEAVDVVGLFVDEGLAVRVDSREGSSERRVDGAALAPDLPLVVLVDGNSASASEIVAGALQDLDRAQVVGVQTFGKGTVQTIQDLSLGAGVKFTTARYFTPSGDSIEGVGVTPDVVARGATEAMLAAAEDVLAGVVSAGS